MFIGSRPSAVFGIIRYGIVRHDSGTRHRRFPSRRGATPFVWRPTSAKQQSCDSDTLSGRRRQLVRVRARVGGALAGRSTAAGSAADPAFSSAWHAAATKPARAAAVTSGHREHRAGWFRRRRTRRHIEHRQSKRGRLGTDGCCLLLVGGVLDAASAFALMILYYMHTYADRSRSDSIIPFGYMIVTRYETFSQSVRNQRFTRSTSHTRHPPQRIPLHLTTVYAYRSSTSTQFHSTRHTTPSRAQPGSLEPGPDLTVISQAGLPHLPLGVPTASVLTVVGSTSDVNA